ncbi:hypothetical protein ACVXHA_24910 [Escherichia coli]
MFNLYSHLLSDPGCVANCLPRLIKARWQSWAVKTVIEKFARTVCRAKPELSQRAGWRFTCAGSAIAVSS